MELLVILLLVILNGVFSMSEIALISSRKSKLEAEAKQGSRTAQAALELAREPTRFLSTVQIGITLISILTGVFSGAGLTTQLQGIIARVSVLAPFADSIAVVLMVIFITYLSVVIGELLPKRIGLTNPEGIIKFMAAPMALLSRFTSPFIWLLTVSSDFLIKLMGIKTQESPVTEEEIKAMIKESASEGTIQEIEHDIVKNVFSLGDRRVGSLMTSRQDIVWLDLNDDLTITKQKVLTRKQSAYPLCQGSLDEVRGMVYLKDLVNETLDAQLLRLAELQKEPLFMPASSKAYHALELFRQRRTHQGIVVDEFGGVVGLVTIDDILDALVGDVSPDSEENPAIIERNDGTFLIDAQMPFAEFAERFHITVAQRRGLSGFHSLGGFALHILSVLPRAGEHFTWEGHYFEIVDVDRSHIDKILFRPKDS
ncbi:HlyC/CorC family transporter [Microvirga sp. STR05]|uniref:HlyC/CorC family transporter n=1 Tax=Hymenobacter duratus TaxID=2771356 RepID=A0ABR8JK94_9BACT|nr:hemolysin family protein [Hymenobacter duratus]MBD2717291.1 HlyC/CorC family transporter [Hymenobacter duratus]MBR7952211.1 HlyC/CorC family transporter [Microvirga sp. STR05]